MVTLSEVTPGQAITTGSDELDKKMGGGIPAHSLTLVEGMSGAGKSTLVQHLLWGAVTNDLPAVMYTTENTVKSFLRQMASLGMDPTDYFLLDMIRVYPMPVADENLDARWAFNQMAKHIRSQRKGSVIVIDSLSTFITQAGEDDVLSFFAQCREACDDGAVVIFTVHERVFDERVLTLVRSLCDAHLRLIVETVGSELIKSMEVAKIKGTDLNTGNIVAYAIEPGIGMRVIPVSKAKA